MGCNDHNDRTGGSCNDEFLEYEKSSFVSTLIQ